MDRRFLRVLTPLVVSCEEAHTETVDGRRPDKNNGYNKVWQFYNWIYWLNSYTEEIEAHDDFVLLETRIANLLQLNTYVREFTHQTGQMCKFAQSASTLVQTDMYFRCIITAYIIGRVDVLPDTSV